jgi:hypothetical protein
MLTRDEAYRIAGQVLNQMDMLRIAQRDIKMHTATAIEDCRNRDGDGPCRGGPDCECVRLQKASWRMREALDLLDHVRLEFYR